MSAHNQSLALIGCGYWGKNLARNFHELGVLHTICETNATLTKELSDTYEGVTIVSEFDQVLLNNSIKQVAIAAPASQHYELVKASLKAGKDVYVEKPLCLHINEAEDLSQLAEKTDKILMVGHLLQYHPVVQKLQTLVAENAFGTLYRICSRRLNLGKIRTEENVLWSFAPHDISVILSLAGSSQPTSIDCKMEYHLNSKVSDVAHLNIGFDNGIEAEIQVSWLHPFKEQKLCIIGEKAMAVFDDREEWPRKLSIQKDYLSGGEIAYLNVKQEEPLKNECSHFISACISREQPKTNAKEGLSVLKILQGAETSAKST